MKVTNLPDSKIYQQRFQPVIVLKTKLRSTCEKYNTIKVPYKDRELNPHIILLLRQKYGKIYSGQREIHRKM